ncbi:MAG: small multi-drug export protein [Eubacteriales bacterium]|nr:small multi-drug export protein [Eubacteriales bacterium]
MKKLITTLLISMFPVVELRGGIPFAIAAGFKPLEAMIICLIGNIIPVPFIMIFIKDIFKFLKKKSPKLRGTIERYENKLHEKAAKVRKYGPIGLMLFVAIPLPGTGAWTGAFIASLLEIRMKIAIPMIFLGLIIAGALITLGCMGIIAL